MRVGILRNPMSTRNLGSAHRAFPDGISLVEVGADKTIADAAYELTREDLDLLIIDGGDGTICAVLSALIARGIAVPPVAFLPNGNTNLIARKTGGSSKPKALRQLVEMSPEALADRLYPTPVLRFSISGEDVRCGFIAGWGAYARGTRMAMEEISARHDKQVAAAIFATLRRSLFGAEAREIRSGIDCRFEADSEPAQNSKRFVGVVTCFEGPLAAGANPFWGKGTGSIRWLDVISPPRFHLLFTPFILFGLRLPLFERLGYRSGRAVRLAVTLAEEMIIDGEIVPIKPNTTVDIDADHHIDILQL